jgi:DNA polymerase epsilon subunit 1
MGTLFELVPSCCAAVVLLQVTASRLCSHCPSCGGGLAASISAAAARKRLTVFSNLAGFHKFRLLQELADMALADGQTQQQQQQQV